MLRWQCCGGLCCGGYAAIGYAVEGKAKPMKHLIFDWNGTSDEQTCYIFGAGLFFGLSSRPKPGDLVIAADGGLNYLQELGIRPDVILGDFDSEDAETAERAAGCLTKMHPPVNEETRTEASHAAEAQIEKAQIEKAHTEEVHTDTAEKLAEAAHSADFVRLSVTKDRSDSAAAILYGKEHGFRRFYLYGCTGKRLDHTLATLQDMAALSKESLEAYLFDDGAVLTAITDASLAFPEGMKGTVSVFAHSARAEGVRESGLLYTVAGRVLENTFPLGLSNAFTKLPASIAVAHGTLIVYAEIPK